MKKQGKDTRRSLHICGATVKVTFLQEDAGISNGDDEVLLGCYKALSNEIFISGQCDPSMKPRIFLHEVLHACIGCSLGNTVASMAKKDQTEEVLVRCLDIGFYDLIRNPKNKWAVEYLLGTRKEP